MTRILTPEEHLDQLQKNLATRENLLRTNISMVEITTKPDKKLLKQIENEKKEIEKLRREIAELKNVRSR